MTLKKSVLILLTLLIILSSMPLAFAETSPQHASTMVWYTEDFLENLDENIVFLLDKNINEISLQINRDLSFEVYEVAINTLSQNNIKVKALAGSSRWVTSKRYDFEALLVWLEEYQLQADKTSQFSALQIDSEFYTLSNCRTLEIINLYKALILEAEALTSKLNISLDVVIPFWFDKFRYNTDQRMNITEWLYQNVDELSIMAYRNFAIGSNSITRTIRQEIELSRTYGKPLNIILETRKSSEGDHLSFYNLGSEYFEQEVTSLRTYLDEELVDYTINIHYYKTLVDLYN